jgi:hypothetical protein
MMTTPTTAIKNEIRELIHLQIEIFGQPAPLTSCLASPRSAVPPGWRSSGNGKFARLRQA